MKVSELVYLFGHDHFLFTLDKENCSVFMKVMVQNRDVKLSATRRGKGQPIIFLNGLGAAQAVWKKVVNKLKGEYEIITFDFRGHGRSSAAKDYSFDSFLSDYDAIMKAFKVEMPILAGWSLGADIAVSYAAMHSKKIGGIVIVDGANPVPEPLVENIDDLRKSLNKLSVKIGMLILKLTPYRYNISSNSFVNIINEVDAHRSKLLDCYYKIDCPITMIMAAKSMGEKDTHSLRANRLWKEGIDQLIKNIPSIHIQWINDSHQLPFKHPDEIAREIDGMANRINMAKQV